MFVNPKFYSSKEWSLATIVLAFVALGLNIFDPSLASGAALAFSLALVAVSYTLRHLVTRLEEQGAEWAE